MKKLDYYLETFNLSWFIPVAHLLRGDQPAYQIRCLLRMVGLPILGMLTFLFVWNSVALHAQTGSLRLPTPGQVWERAEEMVVDQRNYQRSQRAYEASIVTLKAENPEMSESEIRSLVSFEHKSTFLSQIITSLQTAFVGVGIAVLIAVPIGILCGLSNEIYAMTNPFVQLFKPVSPLAWFPVIYILVNSMLPGTGGGLNGQKPFIIAAVVVTLCSLWPTLINTANGVANVERDYLNVAKVLNLNILQKIWIIVLPAALPSIFTGIRLSLGIGWMVLIASEMMAVSPGLGGFIWNWYQSSNDVALSYLLLAVIVIGVIGFILDRVMITAQKLISHGSTAAIR